MSQRTPPPTTNKGTQLDVNQKKPQEKEIFRPKKVIPTKTQAHLNELEPHRYIKNVAQAWSTRLFPIRRKSPQWSLLKKPVPE
jgi:hypothetical protein